MALLTVNNLNDSGVGSLRQAIEDTNELAGKDEIVFNDSLSGAEIVLTSGQLEITDSLNIQGLGAEQLTINGNNEFQIFQINDGTENIAEVEISDLSLINSDIAFFTFQTYGGAILNQEKLTVTNSIITVDEGNNSFNGSGIDNFGSDFNDAELILIDSTIGVNGEGITNREGDRVTVINSAIANNRGNGISDRGGIVEVRASTLSGNRQYGVENSGGSIEIRNSVVSGNGTSNSSNGGGIFNFRGAVNIANSTIADNYSQFSGAGITNLASYQTPENEVTLTSSIVAENRVSNVSGDRDRPDLSGNGIFISGGNNLIGVGREEFINNANGDLVGTEENPLDPRLTPLQDNGGGVLTQALLSDSPAIDAGSNPDNLTADRRGEGFDRVVGNGIDIGAIEFQSTVALVGIVATVPTATEGGDNGIFTISRSGSTAGDLTVTLVLENSSTADADDYNLSGNNLVVSGTQISATIPEGQASIEINLSAIDDPEIEGEETIALRLAASNDYSIDGTNSSAVVAIAANDVTGDTTVTNTNDSGEGSLRQAIINANLTPRSDRLDFDPSLQGQTITLTSGDLPITDSLEIVGFDSDSITIDGNNNSRIFNVDDGNENNLIEVNLNNLTLTDGFYDGNLPNFANNGGGILNRENLTITSSQITNSTSFDSGGAIANIRGNLTLNNSTISGNTSSGGRGGIYNDEGTLTLNQSTVSGNTGGGIFSSDGSSTINNSVISDNVKENSGSGISNIRTDLTINNSTISNNSTNFSAGGILNTGSLTVRNSTISGNSANSRGGGIDNEPYGEINLFNTTISNNQASQGSGIYNRAFNNPDNGTTVNGIVNITSTIIAGNNNSADLAGEASFNSNGNNLIGNGDDATGISNGANDDIIGTTANAIDPLLGTLQNNGGATPTQALLTGSPAIDGGSNPQNLATDQRGEGFNRTLDGNGDGNAIPDIGAFEADSADNSAEGEIIIGTNGGDSLVGGAGNDTIDGSFGRDTIAGAQGEDTLEGGNGRDLVFGDEDSDLISGNRGGDTLEGGSGNDTIFGNQGRDVLKGGEGNDTLIGGNAQDSIFGDEDSDLISGNQGEDTLEGGSGNDNIFGNEGRDILSGGEGNDTLIGGNGRDSFTLAPEKGTDRILDFSPTEDFLLLTEGLSFNSLSVTQNNNDTNIIVTATDELIAVLSNTNADGINESNFRE